MTNSSIIHSSIHPLFTFASMEAHLHLLCTYRNKKIKVHLFCDDPIHTLFPCQRQAALVQYLVFSSLKRTGQHHCLHLVSGCFWKGSFMLYIYVYIQCFSWVCILILKDIQHKYSVCLSFSIRHLQGKGGREKERRREGEKEREKPPTMSKRHTSHTLSHSLTPLPHHEWKQPSGQ